MKKYKKIIAIVLLLIVTFIVFYPGLNGRFTNWDDDIYVTQNRIIKNLSWGNIQKIFTSFILGNYHPLTLLSFAIEYSIFKLNPIGYHTTNLILHLIICLLVFWLIYMLTGKFSIAIITAFVFGLHPLRVDTVAWISGRKDLLCAIFFLGTIISYLSYRKKESIRFYYLAIILFVLSLFSKTMAMTIPVVLLLFDYIQHRKININTIKEKIPFFVISIIFGIVAIIARQTYQETLHEYYFTFLDKTLISLHRLVFYYILRIIAPISLSQLKPYVEQELGYSLSVLLLPSLIIIGVLIVLNIFSVKHTRKIIFASLFFIITLFPALTITIVGYSADRFTYIPAIAVSYIMAEGFYWLYKRLKKNKAFEYILVVILIGMIGILSYLSWKRNHIWKDSVTLNAEFVCNYPDDPRTYINRAGGYNEKKDYDNAIADLTEALTINPNYAEAYHNRGNVYFNKGDYLNAIADFNRALKLKPDFLQAYYDRAATYKDMGQYNLAITDFTKVLAIDQNHINAYYHRGNVYYARAEYDSAIADYSQVLNRDPYHARAYINRGNAYGMKERYDKSIDDYTHAIQIDPESVEAYYNRGNSYVFKEEYDKAIIDFSQAIEIDHKFVHAYINRARAYSITGQFKKAWEDVIKTQEMGIQVNQEFLELLRRNLGIQ